MPFLRSAWPWRSLAYLLASLLPGAAVALVVAGSLALAEAVGGTLPRQVIAAFAGFAVLVPVVPLVAWFERRRLALVDAGPPPAGGRVREAGLALVTVLALWWIDLLMVGVAVGGPLVLMSSPVVQPEATPGVAAVAVVAGALLTPVAAYTVTAWAGARGVMVRALLDSPDARLGAVVRSRARLVDAYELERRRIERDLHDGAQQRLVSLSVTLGLAGLDLPEDSPAGRLVRQAHGEAKQALAELRELIRGVHSPVLTDRGLVAAVRDVAGRSPVPIDLDLDDLGRLPAPVEVTAYYVVSEALTNLAKHSLATRGTIAGRLTGDTLVLEIRDDGRGGADPDQGTGLTGLADRLEVVGGRLSVSSPIGGPTSIRVEIPCA
ncbi:sensor histidine kinase [Nonomuraea sp. NN258]|nr:sensor histidine kinase [Nonomuraea antri]